MQRPSSRQCVYNTGTQRRQTAQSNSNVHGSTTTSQARASMLPSHTSGSSSSQASAAPLPHSFDAEGNIALTAAQTRARDKQREWEGFLKVLRQTEHLQEQLRQLGEKTELLEDGGQAIAKVVENWANTFRATHLALAAMAQRDASRAESELDEEAGGLPTLVRLPTSGHSEGP